MVVDHEAEPNCSLDRRGFVAASAALAAALLLPDVARSASVRLVEGSVRVNGKPATRATRVRAGDLVETGPDSKLVFVVGQDAFLLRAGSSLRLETPPTPGGKVATAGIRLDSGGLLAVFGKGRRLIQTATATATIRGTGVYLEATADQTYFCTCYGEVELRDKTGAERKLVVTGYHAPNMIYSHAVDGRMLAAASVKDHTDVELIMLDTLVGRTSPLARRQQAQEAETKSAQPEAVSEETATAAQPEVQSKRRRKKAPSHPAEAEALPFESSSAGPAPDVPVESAPKPNPPPPPPEPELRLPPARLD